jgi:hypothetical protein
MTDQPQPVVAVVLTAPSGEVLLLHRADGQGWAFPVSLKPGETPEAGAWRGVFQRTSYRLGDVGSRLMRRIKDDGQGVIDATTFICPVESQFTPVLDHKHDAYQWTKPRDVLADTKADAEFLAELEAPAR